MDKKNFIALFPRESVVDATKIYDKFKLASEKGIEIFSNELYTPEIWSVLENLKEDNVTISSYGIFEEAERKIISFNNEYGTYPVDLIKVIVNNKFVTLTHRDFLGSVMALGIERNRIGDMIVKDNCCYFPVHEEITTYILASLNKVRNVTCSCELITEENEIPKVNYEEKNININSLRLDCLVSSIANVSRNEANALLSGGKVLVNYYIDTEKSREIKLESKLTIRGYGKFIIKEILGNSKSGRIKLKIYKFQ